MTYPSPFGVVYALGNVAGGRRGAAAPGPSAEELCRASFAAGTRAFLGSARQPELAAWQGLDAGSCSFFLTIDQHRDLQGGEGVASVVRHGLANAGLSAATGVLLEGVDRGGFRDPQLWEQFQSLKAEGLTHGIGIAPGPGLGYVLDLLGWLDRFGEVADLAMITLSPIEPWPGEMILPAAEAKGVAILAREGAPTPGPAMGREAAQREKRWGALQEGVSHPFPSRLDLAVSWSLAQPAVKGYVPRCPGESTANPAPGEGDRWKAVFEEIRQKGDNTGTTPLKGGTQQFQGAPQASQWPLDDELVEVAKRHGIIPDRDYYCAKDPRDLRDFGMATERGPQATDRRLFLQLQVFTDVLDREAVVRAMEEGNLPGVVYADLNDPKGVAVLLWSEDPLELSARADRAYGTPALREATLRPEFTMLGRTYGFGREDDVNYWLLRRPVEAATLAERPWAVWYPLRRSGAFYRLPKEEQTEMLREHGIIGHHFGSAGYAADIRLECFGIDAADNEFILGILSHRLDWLSKLVKEMRSTKQTGEYMSHLGPFFVGHVLYQRDDA